MENERKLKDCIKQVVTLSLFRSFCEKYRSKESQHDLRNIFARSPNIYLTTKNIIFREFKEELSEDETKILADLIIAFLRKSAFRKKIPESTKIELLKRQNNSCAICGCHVDINSPVDHIVPFKYVGDELVNNYQTLCKTCNERKNDSIDFQMRYLLKSI